MSLDEYLVWETSNHKGTSKFRQNTPSHKFDHIAAENIASLTPGDEAEDQSQDLDIMDVDLDGGEVNGEWEDSWGGGWGNDEHAEVGAEGVEGREDSSGSGQGNDEHAEVGAEGAERSGSAVHHNQDDEDDLTQLPQQCNGPDTCHNQDLSYQDNAELEEVSNSVIVRGLN
jgi:hypothetical protein